MERTRWRGRWDRLVCSNQWTPQGEGGRRFPSFGQFRPEGQSCPYPMHCLRRDDWEEVRKAKSRSGKTGQRKYQETTWNQHEIGWNPNLIKKNIQTHPSVGVQRVCSQLIWSAVIINIKSLSRKYPISFAMLVTAIQQSLGQDTTRTRLLHLLSLNFMTSISLVENKAHNYNLTPIASWRTTKLDQNDIVSSPKSILTATIVSVRSDFIRV